MSEQNKSTDERNALRTRLHNYGLANWVGRSTTTPNDMLRIAQACVEALDQFDTYETEVASWKAVAHDHSERMKVLGVERDLAGQNVVRLVELLKQCADPVACELQTARNNLVMYGGYSSRERRYTYEIAELERLQKEIRALDVRAPLPPDVLADALQDKVHEDAGKVRAGKSVKQDTTGE